MDVEKKSVSTAFCEKYFRLLFFLKSTPSKREQNGCYSFKNKTLALTLELLKFVHSTNYLSTIIFLLQTNNISAITSIMLVFRLFASIIIVHPSRFSFVCVQRIDAENIANKCIGLLSDCRFGFQNCE